MYIDLFDITRCLYTFTQHTRLPCTSSTVSAMACCLSAYTSSFLGGGVGMAAKAPARACRARAAGGKRGRAGKKGGPAPDQTRRVRPGR